VKLLHLQSSRLKYVHLFNLLLLILVYGCNNDVKKESEKIKIDFDKAFENFDIAKKYLKEHKDTVKAISHYIKAADYGYEPRQAYSNAIAYSLTLNDLDKAMSLAFKMTERGFRDIRSMDIEYFSKIKKHPRWEDLKTAIELNAKTYNENLRDFNNAKLITSDIQNFWNAYNLASNETDYNSKRAIYLHHYFEKGTVGLRDFTFLKMSNGIDQFVEFIESHRPYYDGMIALSQMPPSQIIISL